MRSRLPVLVVVDNLMWTVDGICWALWKITPRPYGFRPDDKKATERSLHTSLIRNLIGESVWLSLCATIDPTAIGEQMMDGIDESTCPDWEDEVQATVTMLLEAEATPGHRVHVLAVPLGGGGPMDYLRSAWMTNEITLRDWAGLSRRAIRPTEVARRRTQAAQVLAGIPSKFTPTPLNRAQMAWVYDHVARRGLLVDDIWDDHAGTDQELSSGAAFGDILVDEGGQTDKNRSLNPMARRFVKVEDDSETGASYQVLQALSDTPPGGVVFPGCELLGRVDESGVEVDWAMRLSVHSSADAAKANRKALNELQDQLEQREDEVSTTISALGTTKAMLEEYVALLENDKTEVEARPAIIFATGGHTAEAAAGAAKTLRSWVEGQGYRLAMPPGFQAELFWAMLPGTPTTTVVRQFEQILPSRALAAMMPFISADLGDVRGSLAGWNITTGRLGVVLHDFAGDMARDGSGSLAVAGELGAGKSLLMKTLGGDAVDRGACAFIIDSTPMGEWEIWAKSLTDTTVVDVDDPAYTLDPLRLFDARVASRIATSFAVSLLDIKTNSREGGQLAKLLSAKYLEAYGLDSFGAVLEHLESGTAEIDCASDLLPRFAMYAEADFGRVIFDRTLPTWPEHLRAVVFRTHTLTLPTREEMSSAMVGQLPMEAWFARAYYSLVGYTAQTLGFADRSMLSLLIVDECYVLTGSPEGGKITERWIRDGRKHKAAILMGGHQAPEDFGPGKLPGLIPTRLLMRHRDVGLARSGVAWLGLDETDDALVDMVMTETSPIGPNGVPPERRGEAFMRDSRGTIGRIKVQAPFIASRYTAVTTSPVTTEGEAA